MLVFWVVFLAYPPFGHTDERFLENGTPTIQGSDGGFLLDSPMRQKLDLAGMWAYEVETGGNGTVAIPSAFDFEGRVTFSRTFAITSDQLDAYSFHLVMLGVNHSCEVYLNGDFLVSHSGGYTSFIQKIPENALQPGSENQIRVAVSNQLDDRSTIPLKLQVSGWRNYGGVLRDVFLLATPKMHMRDLNVRSLPWSDFTSARLSIEAFIDGEQFFQPSDPKVSVIPGFYAEAFDKISGGFVARSPIVPLLRSADGWANPLTEILVQNPKLWSPEFPELYVLKAYLVVSEGKQVRILDEMDVNHGIRNFGMSGGDIHLNGQRYTFKGVVWNENHPTWGSSLPYEQMEKDIVLIKNMGANAVRFAGHPPHPYMLNLCDRYGLFALVEIPVCHTPASILGEESYTDLAGTMLREMILRDRNHSSVAAWGIGDGFEVSDEDARGFVATMVDVAKGLDDRPVYYVSEMLDLDVCAELVDFVGITVHEQDVKKFKQRLDGWKAAHPAKPLIVAKFGTEVQHENRNGYSDPLSYEAQARFYLQRFDVLKSINADGAFVWAFNDWKGDRPALTVSTGDPWKRTMGLVSDRREKRLAYDAVRSLFRGEKFVALPSGSYSAAAPIMYVLTGLVLLIGSAYLYNADRRFREGLNRSLMNSYNFFADIREQRVVSVLHSALLGIIVSMALSVVMSTILFHFRDSWVLDVALSYVLPSDRLNEAVIHVILHPILFILYGSLVCFAGLLCIALLLSLLSPLLRSRLYLYHSYSITMWATTPLLILVPVGMILFRLMETEVYVLPALLLVALLLVWVLLRVYKGVSIVADVYRLKVYVVGFASICVVLGIGYLYLDYTRSASEYLSFLYNVVSSSH